MSDNKWSNLDWLQGDGGAPSAPPAPRESYRRDPDPIVSFRYKPTIHHFILALATCAIAAPIAASFARDNDRGMLIEGFIRLSPQGATFALWCLAATLGLSALFLIVVGGPQLFLRRHITLDADAIILPERFWSTRHRRVPANTIRSCTLSTYKRYVFLTIRHDAGKFCVNSTWLPDPESDMQAIRRWLETHVPRPSSPFAHL